MDPAKVTLKQVTLSRPGGRSTYLLCVEVKLLLAEVYREICKYAKVDILEITFPIFLQTTWICNLDFGIWKVN